MIHYECPACGIVMASPASQAGRVETCPDCGSRCRVPSPPAATDDQRDDLPWASPAAAAAPPRRGHAATPRCHVCGGAMSGGKQPIHCFAGRVAGGLAAAIGMIALLAIAVHALIRTTGPRIAPEAVPAIVLGTFFLLIGLGVAGSSRKVLRCRSCGAVVPRA